MRTVIRALIALSVVFIGLAARAEPPTEEDSKAITAEEGEAIIQACLKEDAKACYNYAFYAAQKLDNFATYRLSLKRACGLKHLEACEQLEKDDKEGNEIRKKCDSGDVDSCIHYGIGRARMYEDLIGAIHYAKKACKLGHKRSCEQIKAEQEKVKDGIKGEGDED